MSIKKYTAILIGLTLFASGFAQVGSFNSLTVTDRAGIGASSTDPNKMLWVSRPATDVGPGKATIYSYRAGIYSATGTTGGGSDFSTGVDASIVGFNYFGNAFSSAIAGVGYLDYNNSAVISASALGYTNTAKLCYRDLNSNVWSGYFEGTIYGTTDLILGKDVNNSRWIINSTSDNATTPGNMLRIAPDNNGLWFPAGDNRSINIDRAQGNLGIGLVPTIDKGKLQVEGNARINGTIYCKELRVTTSVWADYVFAKDYKMKSLKEVENFISVNKHLPGIPSEKEVLKNGVNVAEMQTKMLKTMEEMTLHMIALKKENEMLSEKLNKLASYVGKQ